VGLVAEAAAVLVEDMLVMPHLRRGSLIYPRNKIYLKTKIYFFELLKYIFRAVKIYFIATPVDGRITELEKASLRCEGAKKI
jgi:hypothetical protein